VELEVPFDLIGLDYNDDFSRTVQDSVELVRVG
jgi:hypothetical protein